MTAQVAEPIERAISNVPRLEKLQSTSANSIALVVAQFEFGTDVKAAQATIEENIRAAGLPAAVEPQVNALNINASPVIIAAIAATESSDLDTVARIAREEIVPEVTSLEGVAGADLTGGLEPRVQVTLDPDKVAAAGLTVQQIVGVLQANNLTLPSGQLSAEGTKVPVSTTGEFDSVEDIEGLVVGYRQPATAAPGASAGAGCERRPGCECRAGCERLARCERPTPRVPRPRRPRRPRSP